MASCKDVGERFSSFQAIPNDEGMRDDLKRRKTFVNVCDPQLPSIRAFLCTNAKEA